MPEDIPGAITSSEIRKGVVMEEGTLLGVLVQQDAACALQETVRHALEGASRLSKAVGVLARVLGG